MSSSSVGLSFDLFVQHSPVTVNKQKTTAEQLKGTLISSSG